MDFNRKISAYPQKLSETQLHTVSIARAPSRNPLGFTRSLVDVWCMEEVLFFYDLDDLGGIHSTQPTMLVYLCTGYQRFPMLQGGTFNKRAKNFTHPPQFSSLYSLK